MRCVPACLALVLVAAAPPPAPATPPATPGRDANIWAGKEHQPTLGGVVAAEGGAGSRASPAARRDQLHELQRMNRQLLGPGVPPLKPPG